MPPDAAPEHSCTHTTLYQRYRATLLSPERVRELSTLRPARSFADALLCWAWIFAAWTACAVWTTWWVALLVIPVIGCRYYALFIIGHDGMHRRLFHSGRTNDFLADFLIFAPIGAIARINKWNHLEHHRLLAMEADPDRHKYSCFGKEDYFPFAAHLSGMRSFWVSVRNVFVKGPARQRQGQQPDANYTLRDIAMLVGWQVALVVGLTWAIGWWAYPALWLLPGFAFAFLADNVRTFAEHSQPQADEKADEHRLITYLSNPVERLFVAPMNMNYHTAHHLWPSIPYYNLAKADKGIRDDPASEGLEWRGSYAGYLLRYFLALPLEECRRRAVSRPRP